MNRCVSCERPDRAGELLQDDFWCHGCIVEGRYASYLEAQATVDSIVAQRGRREHDRKVIL